ncbi:sensor domain-containing protein [Marinomonas gallaica]|uniref:sensor domain-containing protein n=1 Tax=Marinomonas gallaica TaxID=1806667 RepID=UPI000830CE2C|nr:EAL domain-containing protein [Marinomonas gallaica]
MLLERGINKSVYPSFNDLSESFFASTSSAPFFIIDPNRDLIVVSFNAAAQRYFNVMGDVPRQWFQHTWPNAEDKGWRDQFVKEIRQAHTLQMSMPELPHEHDILFEEICFTSFDHNGQAFIAGMLLNSQHVTYGAADLRAVKGTFELGEFYHSVLNNLHESIGFFELSEHSKLRVVWLNERAKRYVAPHTNVAGQLAVNFMPDSIKSSWVELERSLLGACDVVACSMLLGDEFNQQACEIYFHPVNFGSSKKQQFIANWYNVTKYFQREIVETQHKQDFFNLVENSPDMIVRYDALGRRTYVNQTFEHVTGLSRERVVGKTPTEVPSTGRSAEKIQELVFRAINTRQPAIEILNVEVLDAESVIHEVRCLPEFDKHGSVSGALLIARDMTQQELAKQRTQVSEKQFRTLVENSPDYICRYDLDCHLLYANPAMEGLFGTSVERFYGLTPTELNAYLYSCFESYVPRNETNLHRQLQQVIATQTSKECEVSGPTANGQAHVFVSLTPEFDSLGELNSVLVIGRDITELKEYQEQVHYLSKYDPLTGLPNRSSLLSKVSQLIQFPPSRFKLGLLVLGVDHFKTLNDSYGYEHGDGVLCALSKRLQSVVSNTSYLARIAGDEFGIFLSPVMSRESFYKEAQRINKALAKPMLVDGTEIHLSTSIGACLYPDDAKDLQDLVRYADSALFAAKSSQRGSIRFYSHDLTEKALERLELRNSIQSGIRNKQFCVFFQPKINLKTNALEGAEALVRWHHPTRGLVFPDAFIPVAEELGLINEIDMLVLDEVCRCVKVWQSHLAPGSRFAVNLSAMQFTREDLVSTIEGIVQKHQCGTQFLEFEITEGVLMVHCERLANKIKALKELGFTFALDDFGTGYSSLSYLSRYPIDVLKIDRSFVMDMLESQSSQVLVKTIVAMAQNLAMKVVAEGVEEQAQAALLKQYDVDIAQGYLFSRPISIEAFASMYCLPVPPSN